MPPPVVGNNTCAETTGDTKRNTGEEAPLHNAETLLSPPALNGVAIGVLRDIAAIGAVALGAK